MAQLGHVANLDPPARLVHAVTLEKVVQQALMVQGVKPDPLGQLVHQESQVIWL